MGDYDGNYVTLASVRRTSGIASAEISDEDVKAIIDECEPQVERHYNTKFTPKEFIEDLDGNGTYRVVLRNNPLLAVRDLYIDGTQEDVSTLYIYKSSGKIELTNTSTASVFKEGSKKVVVKYLYGWLEESSTTTNTDTVSVAGTSVALSVDSSTGFTADDWVEVYGMDGNREIAQVSATDTGEITVDQLVFGHVSGSVVVKIEIPTIFKKLINVVCALAMVARIVGQSYTDIVGYTLDEFHVQKGEPYTQWRETATQLIKERDRLMSEVKPRPCVF